MWLSGNCLKCNVFPLREFLPLSYTNVKPLLRLLCLLLQRVGGGQFTPAAVRWEGEEAECEHTSAKKGNRGTASEDNFLSLLPSNQLICGRGGRLQWLIARFPLLEQA